MNHFPLQTTTDLVVHVLSLTVFRFPLFINKTRISLSSIVGSRNLFVLKVLSRTMLPATGLLQVLSVGCSDLLTVLSRTVFIKHNTCFTLICGYAYYTINNLLLLFHTSLIARGKHYVYVPLQIGVLYYNASSNINYIDTSEKLLLPYSNWSFMYKES